MIEKSRVEGIIRFAIDEDIGSGDITTESCIDREAEAVARIYAKEEGIICGLSLIEHIFSIRGSDADITLKAEDGNLVKKGQLLATIRGKAQEILPVERIILNFLQNLSGVATTANSYAQAIEGYDTKLLDTRKTLPGLRYLQKYAVKTGNAENHRQGLYDMVLIKDNHIKVNGSITDAVEKAKAAGKRIEVECETVEQVTEAIGCGCDWIMLDNMPLDDMRKAVRLIREKAPKVKIEASGGITKEKLTETAATGVDFISVGALTHSYKSLDISMDIELV